MKELIRFSLTRRFGNKATKIFNILIFLLIGGFAFSDMIITFVNPAFQEKEVIYIQNIEEEEQNYLNEVAKDSYVFKVLKKKVNRVIEEGSMVLEKKEYQYILHSKYAIDDMTMATFEAQLTSYHKDEVLAIQASEENLSLIEAYNQKIIVNNNITQTQNEVSSDKSNLIFMFVTSIYFMMLSFVSGVASEVVNEKATKTLELILTSVSAKTHFYSKLLVGWLVIIIQGILSISYIIFWVLVRSLYDQGSGLVSFVNHFHLIEIKGTNFYSVLMNLDLPFSFFEKFFYSLIFLLVGILFVQLVLVIASSFVTTIEEAGNIQAPFYLLLLAIYYLVIAINNPHDLSEGIGYYLSFVPLINMLLMPCRFMIQNVPLLEMGISLAISLLIIYYVIKKGISVYERGVLDYSNKGLLEIVKSVSYKRRQDNV